jgi:transposase
VSGRKLQRQYKDWLSDFKKWDQLKHANSYLLFPKNLGKHLSLDETSLSRGELYTVLTNKSAKGKSGTIVAMVAGTASDVVINMLEKLPLRLRSKVEEITLDMAGSMNNIAKKCFPNAVLVTDRFHVQQLANEAVQDLRIKHRWEAIDKENEAIEKAKKQKKGYHPIIFENGDTVKQLLARSRYVLYKNERNWTKDQKRRAEILFYIYPDIHAAYQLSQQLNGIFENTQEKIYAYTRLAQWHERVAKSGFKSFNTISRTIMNHYKTILNYFDNRSTNASAESFNAKIKAFRSQFRGVRNVEFFLYRLTNIYA